VGGGGGGGKKKFFVCVFFSKGAIEVGKDEWVF